MTTIAQPDIAPLPVPVPALDEQQRIVHVLDSHERRIAAECVAQEKFTNLKLALMHDLLTGLVRVANLTRE